MAKKTPEEIFREAQKKAQDIYAATQDPQFRADVVNNAQGIYAATQDPYGRAQQVAEDIARRFEQPVAFDGGARPQGVTKPGMPLNSLERGAMGAIQSMGIPVDVNDMNAYSRGKSAVMNNLPELSMPEKGIMGGTEREIMSEMQQLGIPVTYESMMQYVQNRDAIIAQAQQMGAQAQQGMQQIGSKAQQGMQKGMDWARGLLQ